MKYVQDSSKQPYIPCLVFFFFAEDVVEVLLFTKTIQFLNFSHTMKLEKHCLSMFKKKTVQQW